MFSCAMTHPVIMECYWTSPETEKTKERGEEGEDIQLISCEISSMTNRENGFFKRFLSQPLNLYTLDVITFWNMKYGKKIGVNKARNVALLSLLGLKK